MAVKFYAVKKGRATGIFHTWEECKAQTAGYPGAIYKSFPTAAQAAEYMGWTANREPEEECELVAFIDGTEEICLKERGNDPGMAVMRNVAGEIAASEMAMKYAVEHGYGSIEIIHDYQGIASWCLGEWKTNKEETRRYKMTYDTYKKDVRIKFTKVKGHSGDKYNDIADMLAKQAAGVTG